ncbi:hypothetical protein L3N51_02355 [Metallosphaera sp. J1]|uniref:ATP-binding protein n=1 Tax=Metallosphaera javensis (ex Hofmann et al. 2022) TaxID=99938 RepID=UPI001EDF6095|nr:ATP-binding protein [Metallosphaera javensis (ex Hofmann et al. 2022)]MCG3110058.1 hypothetical protein [Metallosphaera javensis (ex Hofmann et al. 2022)]
MVIEVDRKQVAEEVREESVATVSGLPLVGKTTLLREVKGDKELVELPREFSSVEEIRKVREEVAQRRKRGKVVVEGRSYIIALLLGKAKLGEPSLDNLLYGNMLTNYSWDAMKIEGMESLNEESLLKVIEYSYLSTRRHGTFIPPLVKEGISLLKEGKLDEILPAVQRLKQLYANPPRAKGEAGVTEIVGSVFSPGEMRWVWDRLSDNWKELIYYLLDAYLGLLPGRAREIVKEYINAEPRRPSLNLLDLNFPSSLLDKVERNATQLIYGDLVIHGMPGVGKTEFAGHVARYLTTRESSFVLTGPERVEEVRAQGKIPLILVDYHDTSFHSLRELWDRAQLNARKIYVLTHELTRVMQRVMGDGVTYFNYDLLITPERLNNVLKYDWSGLLFNVVFRGDENLARKYQPLVAMAGKYGGPLPPRFAEMVLKVNGVENQDREVVQYFTSARILPTSEGSVKYRDPFDDYLKEFVDKVRREGLARQFMTAYALFSLRGLEEFRGLLRYVDFPSELADYLGSPSRLPRVSGLLLSRAIPQLVDLYPENCELIPDLFEWKDDEDVKELEKIVEDPVGTLEALVGTLVHSTQLPCLRKAFEYATFLVFRGAKGIFNPLKDIMFRRIMETRDDYLVLLYSYMSMIKDSVDHLDELAQISPRARSYTLLADLGKDDKSPLGILMGCLGMAFGLEKFAVGVLKDFSYAKDFMDAVNEFQRRVNLLKSSIKRVDRESLNMISRVFSLHPDSVVQEMELVLDDLKYVMAFILFRDSYGRDLRDTLRDILNLSSGFCNHVFRNRKDAESHKLLGCYQFKLARALLMGNKYEYRNVVEDILEISNRDDEILGTAGYIASLALGKPARKGKVTILRNSILMDVAEALAGNAEKLEEIRETVKLMGEDALLHDPIMSEVVISVRMMNGEDPTPVARKADENVGIFASRVIHQNLNDRTRYLASLILLVH